MTNSPEMSLIIHDIVTKAVSETLISLGIDASNPIKAQRDFAVISELRAWADNEELQADLAHLRRWRKAVEGATKTSILTTIGVLITGALGALYLGIKANLHLP